MPASSEVYHYSKTYNLHGVFVTRLYKKWRVDSRYTSIYIYICGTDGRRKNMPQNRNKIYAWEIIVNKLINLFIQWFYSTLLGPGQFFSFVILFTNTVGLPGRVISPSQGRYLHTTRTQNKRTHRHSFLEWDSNPLSQRSSERRQFLL
jgi:hypothetical protein